MNTRLLHKFIPLFLVAFLFPAFAADTPATKPSVWGGAGGTAKLFFWKVSSPTTDVYLMGSIHIAPDDTYPLPAEIESAFKAASTLVVEIDITQVDQLKMAVQITQKGTYPQGDSLQKHLSPDSFKAFQKFCQDNGLPFEVFAQMKPGLAMMTALTMVLDKMGMSPENGIDKHFLDQAHQTTPPSKKIIELETVDDQLKLLFDMDDKLADASMADDLHDNSKEELTKLFTAWKTGDVKAGESMLLNSSKKDDPSVAKLMDTMIYSRNDAMAKKIDELLRGKEKVFVVVGAGHLLGDKSILKKLEAKKYKIEQPDVTIPAK